MYGDNFRSPSSKSRSQLIELLPDKFLSLVLRASIRGPAGCHERTYLYDPNLPLVVHMVCREKISPQHSQESGETRSSSLSSESDIDRIPSKSWAPCPGQSYVWGFEAQQFAVGQYHELHLRLSQEVNNQHFKKHRIFFALCSHWTSLLTS